LSPTRIHIFRTFTGSGKTVTSVMWAKFLTKLCPNIEGFVVLSAEYEYGTDEIERIIVKYGNQIDYVRFEGINRLCTQLNTKINRKGITIRMLRKNGISTITYCKDECVDYNTCVYMGNCKKTIMPVEEGGVKNWIGVQHQLGAFFPIYLYHVDEIILIIDEEFSDAIKSHYIYGVPIFKKNISFLNRILKDINHNIDKNYRYFLTESIKLLEMFITSIYAYSKRTITELDYETIGDILDDIDTAKGTDDHYIKKTNAYAFEYIKTGKISPFKFIFGEIIDFIDNYEILRNNKGIEEWMRSAFYMKEMHISFLYYNRQLLRTLLGKDNILKMIINDATADEIQLKYLIGDIEPIQDHWEDQIYENCEVHQLKKKINKNMHGRDYAHYGKYSFFHYPSSKSTFKYIMDDLRLILERHKDEPVLIGAREITKEEFKHINGGIALSKYIQTLGYSNTVFVEYPVKATNEFSNINVAVVLMNAELPEYVVKRQSNLCGMDLKIYRESYSKNNITQFIGRVFRGNEHKFIYIIPAIDIPLFKKTKYHTYRSHTEFKNYLKKQIKLKEEEKKYSDIIYYLEKHKFIAIEDCQGLFGISRHRADMLLSELEKKKLISKGNLRTNRTGQPKIIYSIK